MNKFKKIICIMSAVFMMQTYVVPAFASGGETEKNDAADNGFGIHYATAEEMSDINLNNSENAIDTENNANESEENNDDNLLGAMREYKNDEDDENAVISLFSEEEYEQYHLEDTISIDFSENHNKTLKIIPSETGLYEFKVEPESYKYISVYLRNDDMRTVTSDRGYTNLWISGYLIADKTYYLNVSSYSCTGAAVSSRLLVFDEIEDISIGESDTVQYNENTPFRWYTFTAESTEMCAIKQSDNDVNVYVYDENAKCICSNSSTSYESIFNVQEGMKYYIYAHASSYNYNKDSTIHLYKKDITELDFGENRGLQLGDSYTYEYFTFTASADGAYDIESLNNNTHISAYYKHLDDDQDNDFRSPNNGFYTSLYMQAGETILIKIYVNSTVANSEIDIDISEGTLLSGTISLPEGSNVTETQSVSCRLYGIAAGTNNSGIFSEDIEIPQGEVSADYKIAVSKHSKAYENRYAAVSSELNPGGDHYLYDYGGRDFDFDHYTIEFLVRSRTSFRNSIIFYNKSDGYTYNKNDADELPIDENVNLNTVIPDIDYVNFTRDNTDYDVDIYLYKYGDSVREDVYYETVSMRTGVSQAKLLISKDDKFTYAIGYNNYRYNDNDNEGNFSIGGYYVNDSNFSYKEDEASILSNIAGQTYKLPFMDYNTVEVNNSSYSLYDKSGLTYFKRTYDRNNDKSYFYLPPDTEYIIYDWHGVYYTGNAHKPWSADINDAQIFNSDIDQYHNIEASEIIETTVTFNNSSSFYHTIRAFSAKSGTLLTSASGNAGSKAIINIPKDEPYKLKVYGYSTDLWIKSGGFTSSFDDAACYTSAQTITMNAPDYSGHISITSNDDVLRGFNKIPSSARYKIAKYKTGSKITWFSKNGETNDFRKADTVNVNSTNNINLLNESERDAYIGDIKLLDSAFLTRIFNTNYDSSKRYILDFIEYDGLGNEINKTRKRFVSSGIYAYINLPKKKDTKYFTLNLKNADEKIIDAYSTLNLSESVQVSDAPKNENNVEITAHNASEAKTIKVEIERIHNALSSCNIYLAAYDENNVLCNIYKSDKVIFGDDDNHTVTFGTSDLSKYPIDSIKIFAWSDNISPLMESYIID